MRRVVEAIYGTPTKAKCFTAKVPQAFLVLVVLVVEFLFSDYDYDYDYDYDDDRRRKTAIPTSGRL